MACPDCCCDIPENESKNHITWEYVEHAAQFLRGLERIHLTGGEPSLHPKFREWVPALRDLFKCKLLTVESNGYGFQKFPEVFTHFDVVYASLYSEATFAPGGSTYWRPSLDNAKKIKHLVEYYANRPGPVIYVGNVVHTPRHLRPGTKMCPRGTSENAAYADGPVPLLRGTWTRRQGWYSIVQRLEG